MCGISWVIEQPISSLFFMTPAMLSTIAYSAATRTSFPMSSFGHATEKMTQLVGTTDWLPQMSVKRARTRSDTPRPAKAKARATGKKGKAIKTKQVSGVQKGARATGKTATSCKNKQVLGEQINTGGKRTYNGNKGKLKDSQVYPVKFALSIVQKHWPERFGVPAEQQ